MEDGTRKGDYVVFADHKFASAASGELRQLFGAGYSDTKPERDNPYFTAKIDCTTSRALSRIKTARPVFVDMVVPVHAVLPGAGIRANLIGAVGKLLNRKRTFKIEAKKMGGLEGRARDVEVLIGKALEAEGFKVDLKNPDIVVYLLFLRRAVIIGKVNRGQVGNYVLDRFRSSQGECDASVNRAEFKLKEALEFFGINLSGIKRALDIGAAPGGWTHHLLSQGIRVVAVDNAVLDYAKVCEGLRALVLAKRDAVPALKRLVANQKNIEVADIGKMDGGFGDYKIVHIKSSIEGNSDLIGRLGGFGLLTIDTNTMPSDSAKIAASLSDLLENDARLIMTVKLFGRDVKRRMREVEGGLGGHYREVGLKKLPHNRDELTLYAKVTSDARRTQR